MRGNTPAVSIIIPAYNHAAWIEQALDSVAAQSFTSWELIIIEDASRDDSWKLITTWAKQHPHLSIRCIQHTQNQGAPATLNEGLSLAQGEYISILNSDDAWYPQRLERLHKLAKQQHYDFLVTAVDLWDEKSAPKKESEADWLAWYQGLGADYQKHQNLLRTLLRGNFCITTSNFFFKRECFLAQGGFADVRYVHDDEYVLRLYRAGFKLSCLWNESLLHYRLHTSNTIREKPLAAIEENMQMLLSNLTLLSEQLTSNSLAGLQIQLRDLYRYTREEWLSTLHHRLVAREATLMRFVKDRDKWIQERNQWIAERDEVIQSQRQWIVERDTWIQERNQWIVERDQQIQGLQQALLKQVAWVKDRDQWIAERDQLIQSQQQWISDRERWIAERDTALVNARQQQAELINSRAFRLGNALLNPLRILRRLIPEKRSVRHA